MDRRLPIVLAGAALVLVLLSCLFTVSETQLAVRQHFGAIADADYQPGLHPRFPWPIDTVEHFERRIVTQEYQNETFLTSENKGLIVDFYIKWRIADARTFFRATGGSEDSAGLRLAELVKDGVKAGVAQRTLPQIVTAERAMFTGDVLARASASAMRDLGIQLVDVRLQRIDLVDEVSGSIYQRMQESFNLRARQVRAQGSADAEKLRADADRQRAEIIANGTRDAQRLRGEGDAAAANIYSRAYGKNAEFAAFYQSMQAYRESIGREGDVLVIDMQGDFYKYLHNPARH